MTMQLSTKTFDVQPFQTTHYRKPVTWYSIHCLKCDQSAEYRSESEVIAGRRGHKCPPKRGYLARPQLVVAGGSTWSTRLRLRIGDRVSCPYWYDNKPGTVTALSSDYSGPTKTVTTLLAYWP